MIKVSENKIEGSFEVFEDFFKAVDTSITDKDHVYISVENNELSFFAEDKFDGMASGVSVSLKIPVNYSGTPFNFGVNAERIVAFVKKLYPGSVKISLKSNKKGTNAEFEEDNIKASFSVIAKKRRMRSLEFSKIEGDACSWIVSGVGDCLASIAETSKKSSTNKFSGILVDTKNEVSRVCKFSNISFYVKTGPAVFNSDCRFVLPDNLAKICRTFKKTVKSILISGNMGGVELENGTLISMPIPHDYYPVEYANHLSIPDKGSIIESKDNYIFDSTALSNAVELVSSSLGSTDSWISMKILGQSGDKLVWEVSGKSHQGVEVSEKILSSHGKIIDGMILNKDRLIKSLKLFSDDLYLCDLSSSVAAFTDVEGQRVSMLVKARL